MEIRKIRKMLEMTQAAFGEVVGTHGRNIRLYEKEPDKTPWMTQSRGDRAIGPRYIMGTDIDGTEYIVRLHRPGLVAEPHVKGKGYTLTITSWLDPTPSGKDLAEVVGELKAYWSLRNANR
jgi:hypothetical protein